MHQIKNICCQAQNGGSHVQDQVLNDEGRYMLPHIVARIEHMAITMLQSRHFGDPVKVSQVILNTMCM